MRIIQFPVTLYYVVGATDGKDGNGFKLEKVGLNLMKN